MDLHNFAINFLSPSLSLLSFSLSLLPPPLFFSLPPPSLPLPSLPPSSLPLSVPPPSLSLPPPSLPPSLPLSLSLQTVLVYGGSAEFAGVSHPQWLPESIEGLGVFFGITAFLFCVHSMVRN